MKLLYITNGVTPSGGLERVLSIKASFFAEYYGYEVAIITLNEEGKKPFYDFSSKIKFFNIQIRSKREYLTCYFPSLNVIVSSFQPDIISVCDDGLKGLYIPFWLKKSYKKIIYERHVSKMVSLRENSYFTDKIFSKLLSFGAKKFDKVVLLTTDNIKEWQGLRNLTVIPNPLSFFPKLTAALENKQVIVVGRFEYQKGYDSLLYMWKEIEKYFSDWQLKIYGNGSLKKEIQEQIKNLNLQHVSLNEPIADIEKAYLESSVYAMTSRYEGFGMVLIEAMACGVPCISFDCPCGPKDIITNGKNGFLIPLKDNELFVRKLSLLMKNVDLRKRMGQHAKASVKKYNPEFICSKWNDLFLCLLND